MPDDNNQLPGFKRHRRPVFGKPLHYLPVPAQHIAPTLELRVQVVDEPEAKRQAEIFNGQTDMFTDQEKEP